jgi:hypothetical protein
VSTGSAIANQAHQDAVDSNMVLRMRSHIPLPAWIGVGLFAVGCDAGKAPYNEAVALEEKGLLSEAADKYDAVCRRAPDSKFCPPSQTRAAKVRLDFAEQRMRELKFEAAREAIAPVLESADSDAQKRAKTMAESPEMTMGLRWEKALAAPDKASVLKAMEEIATSTTPVAAKAKEWLAAERPSIWLARAKEACAKPGEEKCPANCRAILEAYPNSEQAGAAKKLLEAYGTAEAARIHPLLTEAEKMLQECVRLWSAEQAYSNCTLRQLAVDDNPLRAVAVCGDHTAASRQSEKLDEAWAKLLQDIGDETRTTPLQQRWTNACEHGEYKKVDLGSAPKADEATDSADCYPCSTQEDFDIAWTKRKKCCPVRGCEGDTDCSGGRVCCRIPMGTLCTDAKRCGARDRVP